MTSSPTSRPKLRPGLTAWLLELRDSGPRPRPRSPVGQQARDLGYTQDVLRAPGGRLLTEVEARDLLGPTWFQQCDATGLEALTKEGIAALANLD